MNTFCSAAWKNLFVYTTGSTGPCCVWNTNELFDRDCVQQQMLNNQEPKGCSKCFDYERAGYQSYRQVINRELPFDIADKNYTSVEVAVDNTCNLECHMCSSISSHKIARREQQLFGRTAVQDHTVIANTTYTDIDWSCVTRLRLYGGEPMYSPGTVKLLQYLQSNMDIATLQITVPTNATVLPNPTILAVLTSAQSVYLDLSIDGWGDINTYQRPGVPWSRIESNLNWYYQLQQQHPHIHITINSTVTVLNALAQAQLRYEVSRRYPQWHVHREMCISPPWYNLRNLPEDLKQQYRTRVGINDIRQWLDQPGDPCWDATASVLTFMDQYYHSNLADVNPILAHYLAQNPAQTTAQDLVNLVGIPKIGIKQ